MKIRKLLLAVAGIMALAGCRQELAEITYLLDQVEPLVIERGMLADRQNGPDQAMGACVQAPDMWGAPTVVASGTSDGGVDSFSETPTDDAVAAADAEGLLPRADHTWYCYDLAEKSYSAGDRGSVSWEFPSGSEPAQVLTTIGSGNSFVNLVVHDVIRGTKVSAGMWATQTVVLAGDERASLDTDAQPLSRAGSFKGRALLNRSVGEELLLVAADGAITVEELPFEAMQFNQPTQIVVTSPARLIGFVQVNLGEFTAYTSTDGASWNDVGSIVGLGDGLTAAYNTKLGRFVVGLNGAGDLHYSVDGTSWSAVAVTGAVNIADSGNAYAFLPDGTEAVRGDDLIDDVGLFVRPAGGDFSQALSRPPGASADWYVESVIAAGNRLFASSYDPAGTTGEEYTLQTSTDGISWQQIGQTDIQNDNSSPVAAARGNLMVVGFNSAIYTSADGGVSFVEVDPGVDISALLSNVNVSLKDVFVENGTFFLELVLDNGTNRVAAMFTSTDLDAFALSASQGDPAGSQEFALYPVSTGSDVLLVGEDPNGFKVYKRFVAGSKSSSGGSLGLFTGLMLLVASARRRTSFRLSAER